MKRNTIIASMLLAAITASGQGSVEDYDRAYSLTTKFSSDSVLHWCRNATWHNSSHVLTYSVMTAEGRKHVAFDAEKLASTCYDTKEEMDKALGIMPKEPGKPHFGRRHERHWMEVDEEREPLLVISPDGKTEAYIEEYNVVLHTVGEPYTKKRILTRNGTIGKYYSNRIAWSPDGKKLFVCKRRPVEKRYAYYVESSPSDQLQPMLHKQEYAKPGDELPQHYPVIIDIATGKAVEADASKIDNQYSLEWMRWSNDGSEVTMDDNVDPSSTYQVAAALIRANKNFELVMLPGVHHTMGENFGEHKRYDFFVKNLLGVDPPKWSEVKDRNKKKNK